ncbi:Translation initiation factor eIF-2B subunit beta [Aphelenchoides fujianensis]|nr:Translation initiation factor eIF-2B subunit beta [Aphelenchoides fujianensis]
MVAVDAKAEAIRTSILSLLRKNNEKRQDSYQFAKQVALKFRNYVSMCKYKSAAQLLNLVRSEGDLLLEAHPTEFVLRNVLCATLKIIREETQKLAFGNEEEVVVDSLNRLWIDPRDSDLQVDVAKLKKEVVSSLEDFAGDLEDCRDALVQRASDHVLPSDTVMTFKYSGSSTLQDFLKNSKCCIISVDDETSDDKTLPFNGIRPMEIVVMIGGITRVVLSAIAVLPDGSCITPSGTRAICEVAKQHSVPVVVCAAFFKFTPTFVPNIEVINRQAPGAELLGENSELMSLPHVRVSNPLFDHIPAKLVALYVTQTAAVSPPHVYRLFNEQYHPDDFFGKAQ